MKILVVGGGGREHAIITSIAKSSKVTKIYCAPGNAGIAELAECVDIGVMEFDKLVDFAKKEAIDLAVVAPDDPLVAGAVDTFEAAGIRAFGPRANAAIIEGSKAFSKDLMKNTIYLQPHMRILQMQNQHLHILKRQASDRIKSRWTGTW